MRRTSTLLLVLVAAIALGVVSWRLSRPSSEEARQRRLEAEAWELLHAAPASPPQGLQGRFRPAPTGATPPSAEELALVESLGSVGYLDGYDAAGGRASGVTVHDRTATAGGTNVVLSGHEPGARLLDMEGRELHRWSLSFRETWPDHPVPEQDTRRDFWRRAHVFADGGILAIYEGLALVRLDRDSQVQWAFFGHAHHDMQVLDDGRILVLTRKAHVVPEVNPERPILEDFVSLLSPGGELLREASLVKALWRSPFTDVLGQTPREGDVLHANSVEWIDGHWPRALPRVQPGHVLVSLHTNHALATLDLDEEVLTWAHLGSWRFQHNPTVLADGRVMLFNNRAGRRRSSILVLDAVTGQEEVHYTGTPESPFHSDFCGSNQPLPGGNTLITETDRGRAFEIDAEGRIAWEYWNPHRAGRQDELIATLLDVVRLPPDFPLDWARWK